MKTLIKSACKLSVIFIVITDFNGQNNLDLIKFFNMKESFSIRFFHHIAIFIQPHFQLYVLPFFPHYFFQILCFRSTHLLSSLFIQCSVVAVFFVFVFVFAQCPTKASGYYTLNAALNCILKKTIHSPGIYDYIFHVRVMFNVFFFQSIFGIAISHESIFNNTFLEDFHFNTFPCHHVNISDCRFMLNLYFQTEYRLNSILITIDMTNGQDIELNENQTWKFRQFSAFSVSMN